MKSKIQQLEMSVDDWRKGHGKWKKVKLFHERPNLTAKEAQAWAEGFTFAGTLLQMLLHDATHEFNKEGMKVINKVGKRGRSKP